MPFITYWKGKIKLQVSDAIVCQVDFLASIAQLIGTSETSTDSENMLDAFLGTSQKGRDHLILEATRKTALRSGDWLYIPAYEGKNYRKEVGIEVGNFPYEQLYNITKDIKQLNNLANSNAEKRSEMKQLFEKLRGKDYTVGVKEVVFK